MFTFLKGIKWFEWLGLAAIALVVLTIYEVWVNYDALKVKFAVTEQKVQIANDTINRQVDATKITDQSLAEHSKTVAAATAENAASRQEVINEYLDNIPKEAPAVADGAIGQPAEPPKAKAEVPTVPVSRVAKAPVLPRPQVPTADPDADNLRRLADRMRERYCRAYPDGNHCPTQ